MRERERELWQGAGGREQGRGRQGERWESGGCLVLDEREPLRPATRLVRSCDYGRCVLEIHSRARHWATAKNQRRTKLCHLERRSVSAVRDLAGRTLCRVRRKNGARLGLRSEQERVRAALGSDGEFALR